MGSHKEQVWTGLIQSASPGISMDASRGLLDEVPHNPLGFRGLPSVWGTLTLLAKLGIARQGLGGTGSLLELTARSWGSS